MRRRALLATGGALALGVLAGCAGDESTPVGTTTSSETTPTTEAAPANGAETTETGTDELPQFGSLYRLENNYAITATYSEEAAGFSGTAEIRRYGADSYQRVESGEIDHVYEIYRVDGTDYLVIDGETCFEDPGSSVEPDADVDEDAETYVDRPDAGLTASGRTTIDGTAVYVYDVTGEDVEDPLTLYVSVATGYLRRAETDAITLDFHSWGEVDPITKPDMECQSFGT